MRYILLLLAVISFAFSKEFIVKGKIIGVHYQGVGGGYGIEPIDGTKGSDGRDFLYLCFYWDDEKIVNMLKNLEESGKIVTIAANKTKKSIDAECSSIRLLPQAHESSHIFNQSTAKLSDNEYSAIKSVSSEYASVESQMIKAYSYLKKILNPVQREQLRTEQIAWIKQRDQKVYEADKKGSKKYIEALIRLTKERAEYLSAMAK